MPRTASLDPGAHLFTFGLMVPSLLLLCGSVHRKVIFWMTESGSQARCWISRAASSALPAPSAWNTWVHSICTSFSFRPHHFTKTFSDSPSNNCSWESPAPPTLIFSAIWYSDNTYFMCLSLPSWVRMLWKPGFFLSCFQNHRSFSQSTLPAVSWPLVCVDFPSPPASEAAALGISVLILSLSTWRLGCGNHENAFIMSD